MLCRSPVEDTRAYYIALFISFIIVWVHLKVGFISVLKGYLNYLFIVFSSYKELFSLTGKKNYFFFFEHAEASSPDSKLSLIEYSSSDSKHSITLMIDARCSGRISSNKLSVML